MFQFLEKGGRDIKKCREATFDGADGVVAHTEMSLVSDHPGRSASTPPHEEGNGATTILRA